MVDATAVLFILLLTYACIEASSALVYMPCADAFQSNAFPTLLTMFVPGQYCCFFVVCLRVIEMLV